MSVIADLQLHSRFARAVSSQMNVPTIAQWAAKKGIGLVATGDWTHPLWFRELQTNLEEAGQGVYRLRSTVKHPRGVPQAQHHLGGGLKTNPFFLLSTEISSIYSQGGKVRKVHTLIFSPSFEVCEKINRELTSRGANLFSDGRPIVGLSAKAVAEIALSVNPRCLIIPAHCLLPGQLIQTKDGVNMIENVKKGNSVLTHKGRFNRVIEIFKRQYKGEVYHIRPWYFSLGLKATSEHPFFALRPEKNCSWVGGLCKPNSSSSGKHKCRVRHYEKYRPGWIPASKLTPGDILIYPRLKGTKYPGEIILGDTSLGKNNRNIPQKILINKDFGKLTGYYLAEGYLGKNSVCFCFSDKEGKCILEVKTLMQRLFGLSYCRRYRKKNTNGVELMFFSTKLASFFRKLFYTGNILKRAQNKRIPGWMLFLSTDIQKEIFVGWWQGDKGYTSSAILANQMKTICLRLGILPSIVKNFKEGYAKRGKHFLGKRTIKANFDNYYFSHLAFFEDSFSLLEMPLFSGFKRKLGRRHGWIDKDYIYLPIRKIEESFYEGEVYNLEVGKDNSYVSEFAAVHNCWTPHFSIFGSESGFDSIEECFGDLAPNIHAIETGLSSDPAMNWRIKELDSRSIVSFSDAHSPAKLGREATVFELPEVSYENVRKAIIEGTTGDTPKISFTIEFYPQEGKYHYTGHRNCNVVYSPEDEKRAGKVCPVCARPLTVGVESRVESLGKLKSKTVSETDEYGVRWIYPKEMNRPGYVMLVPLMEIFAEAYGVGVGSRKVINNYELIINKLGTEFKILLETKLEEIKKVVGERVAEAISKVRSGDIVISPGYDGVFGKVKIFDEGEKEKEKTGQASLF